MDCNTARLLLEFARPNHSELDPLRSGAPSMRMSPPAPRMLKPSTVNTSGTNRLAKRCAMSTCRIGCARAS